MQKKKRLIFIFLILILFSFSFRALTQEISLSGKTAKEIVLEKYYTEGRIHFEAGNYLKAMSCLSTVLILDPNYKDAGVLLKDAELRYKSAPMVPSKTAEEEKILPPSESITKIEKTSLIKPLLSQAKTSLKNLDYLTALEFFSRALGLEQENREAQEGLEFSKKMIKEELSELKNNLEKIKQENESLLKEKDQQWQKRIDTLTKEYEKRIAEKDSEWQKRFEGLAKTKVQDKVLEQKRRLQELLKALKKENSTLFRNLKKKEKEISLLKEDLNKKDKEYEERIKTELSKAKEQGQSSLKNLSLLENQLKQKEEIVQKYQQTIATLNKDYQEKIKSLEEEKANLYYQLKNFDQ
ncbi:MAG: hypothetical protein N2Z79_05000, partial [Candidatus Omnitrophica bacterium]|nr:hypothetical protein [Candidatus Omnitrophota bacterium]